MALCLGNSLNREYKVRLPFLDGNYNIGTFFNKKSSFLLFSVSDDHITDHKSVKINMFKNLRSSKFCETFIKLHDYKKTNLDIINQYDRIKEECNNDINLFMNETVYLAKYDFKGKDLFDTICLYGFTLNSYNNEFIFLIAERQNIITKLSKKIVRTTGCQISTTSALNLLNEYHDNYKQAMNIKPKIDKEIIKLN